jgi:hypothetical protein
MVITLCELKRTTDEPSRADQTVRRDIALLMTHRRDLAAVSSCRLGREPPSSIPASTGRHASEPAVSGVCQIDP